MDVCTSRPLRTCLLCAWAAWLSSLPRPATAEEVAGPAVLPPPGAVSTPSEPLLAPAPTPAPGPPNYLLLGPDGGAAPEAAVPIDEPITPTPHWYQPGYWFGPAPWDAGVELGINGSQGNNETFSMRAGGHLKRKTDDWKFDSSLAYNKNAANGTETQNNGKLDVRLDRILDDSPWSLFFLENLIYDEFQAWDLQLSLNTGVGYQFLDTPALDLTGRIGAGATREFGGTNEDWEPTALFGLDYEHQITKQQKLTAKVDYYPEWADFTRYRIVSDFGWQIDLDCPEDISLKLSLIDWYDSTPDGADPNSFNYAVLMIWSL